MPRISEFYGIFVYMYFLDTRQHHTPHVHVRYGEYKASFSIETGDCSRADSDPSRPAGYKRGSLPAAMALDANWHRALRGETLEWIDP